MADNFGLKIGLEGEKEFKKALADINQSFKVLGSEMKVVQSQFDKNDDSVEALTARNQVLGKEIDAQKKKIETLRQALENASTSFGENDRRTQQWQIQLNNAQAALNNMERELDQNQRAIDSMGDEMGDAAQQTDKFGDEIDDAADKTDKASGKLEKVGSVLKGLAVTAGAAVAGLTKSFLDLAESTREYREDQAKLDAAFLTAGFTAEQAGDAYTGFYAILGEEDRSVEAVNHLAKLCSTEEELAKWTDIAAGVWATFGDSLPIEGLTEAANETAKTGQLTGVLADALNWAGVNEEKFQSALDGCSSEQERAALITDTLNGLYEEAAENYKELNGDVMEAQRAHALLTDAYAQLGAIAEPIMTTLKTMAADLLTAMLPFVSMMGEGLQGILNGTAGAAETFAEGVSGLVEVLMEKLSTLIPVIGEALLTSLPVLLEAGVNIVTALLTGITQTLPQLTAAGLSIVMELLGSLLEALPSILQAAAQVITTLATGIAEALPTLIPALVQVVTQMVQTLLENLPLILDAALQLITGLAQGILDAIPVLIEVLPAVITGIVEFLVSAIPQIIDAGIQLLTSLVTALPEILETIVAVLPQIIEGIITALLEGLPLIVQAGFDLLTALIQALPEIIEFLVTALPQITTAILNAFTQSIPQFVETGFTLFVSLIQNLPAIIVELLKAVPQIISSLVQAFTQSIPRIVEVGANLVRGLWQGIQSLAGWLWDKVSGWISSIWDGICDFFGIASPSKEMDWVGQMLVEGLSGSLDKNGKQAVRSAEQIAKDINGVMQNISTDMMTGIPSSIDIHTALTGLDGFRQTQKSQAFNVTIPLTIDGSTLARILAEIQWTQNAVYLRNLGVT